MFPFSLITNYLYNNNASSTVEPKAIESIEVPGPRKVIQYYEFSPKAIGYHELKRYEFAGPKKLIDQYQALLLEGKYLNKGEKSKKDINTINQEIETYEAQIREHGKSTQAIDTFLYQLKIEVADVFDHQQANILMAQMEQSIAECAIEASKRFDNLGKQAKLKAMEEQREKLEKGSQAFRKAIVKKTLTSFLDQSLREVSSSEWHLLGNTEGHSMKKEKAPESLKTNGNTLEIQSAQRKTFTEMAEEEKERALESEYEARALVMEVEEFKPIVITSK